jgi:hypothetical protein
MKRDLRLWPPSLTARSRKFFKELPLDYSRSVFVARGKMKIPPLERKYENLHISLTVRETAP